MLRRALLSVVSVIVVISMVFGPLVSSVQAAQKYRPITETPTQGLPSEQSSQWPMPQQQAAFVPLPGSSDLILQRSVGNTIDPDMFTGSETVYLEPLSSENYPSVNTPLPSVYLPEVNPIEKGTGLPQPYNLTAFMDQEKLTDEFLTSNFFDVQGFTTEQTTFRGEFEIAESNATATTLEDLSITTATPTLHYDNFVVVTATEEVNGGSNESKVFLPLVARHSLGDGKLFFFEPGKDLTITTFDHRLQVLIPANALDTDAIITYHQSSSQANGDFASIDNFFELQANNGNGEQISQFNHSLTLRFKYDEIANVDESKLQLHYFNETLFIWVPIPSKIDTENNEIIAEVNQFSKFKVTGGSVSCPYPVGQGPGVPIEVTEAFSTTYITLGIEDCPKSDVHTWAGVYIQDFPDAAIIYNAGLGQAFYLHGPVIRALVNQVPSGPGGWIGLPTSNVDEAGPINEFKDENYDFTGQPIAYFEDGFIGFNGSPDHAQAHRPFPQVNAEVTITPVKVGADYEAEITFNFNYELFEQVGAEVALQLDYESANFCWIEHDSTGGNSWNVTYPDTIPLGDTVEFWMNATRNMGVPYRYPDDLTGYAPCDYFINDTLHSFVIPVVTDTVTTYSFPYTCAGYDGTPPAADTTPPTIDIIEVYNDGEGSISILAFIRDDRAVASAEIAGQPGVLSRNLAPFIEGGLGADLYAAQFIEVPANALFDFVIVATDTSGNTAIKTGAGFSNYSNFFGALECGLSLCGTGYQESAGNPVTTYLGNKVETFELLSVDGPGLADINFDVTYNGQSIREGIFGIAISSDVEWRLETYRNPILIGAEIFTPEGNRIKFEEQADGSYVPVSNSNADTLEKTANGYMLTTTGNFRYLFDEEGHLVQRLDRNDNALSYSYADDQLISVSNGGYTVTLTYNGDGYVESLLFGEKVVSLTYDGNKLINIQDPEGGNWGLEYDTREIGEIIDERGEEYAYVAYHHYLTRVTTPEGRVKNQQVYDEEGRVISQTSMIVGQLSYEYVVYPDESRETHIFDAYGNPESHYYNELGQLWKQTDREGNSEFYFYDDNFTLIRKIDANGYEWEYVRDAKGNILEIFGPLDYYEVWEYNDFNQPTYFKDADGYEWRWEYDEKGNLLKTIRPDNSYSEMIYDDRGLPTDSYDFNGNHIRHKYEPGTGNLVRTWDGENSVTEFTRDQYGRIKTQVLPSGAVWTYTYDLNDHIISKDGPLGYQVEYVYDADGQLIAERDADENGTHYLHDDQGRLIEATDAEERTVFYRYGAMNELLEVENARHTVTQYIYDKNYRVIQTDMPGNVTLTYQYDGKGNVIRATNGEEVVTLYEYDGLGRMYRMVQNYVPGGESNADTNVETTYEYDLRGNLLKETNPLGDALEYGYDGLGRLIWSENEEDERTAYQYDANGNVKWIQYPEQNTVEMEYNARNQPILMRDGEGYETEMHYDINGNLEKVVAPDGIVTYHEYNLLDQLIATTKNYVSGQPENHDTNVTTYYEYSLEGDLLSVVNAEGYEFSYEYDGVHQLVREINPAGIVQYIYDEAGNLKEKIDANEHSWRTEYDLLNRKVQSINPEGHTVTYIYDRANNLIKVINARHKVTEMIYDALGRSIKIKNALGYETLFTYDAMGNLLALEDGNRHTTYYEYDRAQRLITRIDAEGYRVEYEYDDNGRLILQRIPFDDPDRTIVETRTYDRRDLLETFTNGEGETIQYAYNSVRLLESQTENDGVVTYYGCDGIHRLSQAILNYDGTGVEVDDRNVTYNYRYDRVGNLVSVVDPLDHETRFDYDGMNRLIHERDADGNIWSYAYDPVGNRIARTDANNNQTFYYYYSDNQLQMVEYGMNSTAVVYTYDENNNRLTMVDHLGTTTWVYDDINRITDVTDPFERHVGYEYDAVNRIAITYPDGRLVNYTYYRNDWLQTVTDPEGYITHYVRDNAGRPTSIINPNSTISEISYDRASRILSLVNRQTRGREEVISAFSYTYNAAGFKSQMVAEYGWRNPSVVTSTYTYDGLRRLIRDEDSEGVWTAYKFDRASNRIELRTNDDSTSPRPFDELTLVYAYSDNNQLMTVIGNTHPGSPNVKWYANAGQALYAFQHEVMAQQGKHITAATANELLDMVDTIIADLEDTPVPDQSDVLQSVEALRTQVIAKWNAGDIDSEGIANSLLAKLDYADQASNGVSGELQTTTFTYDGNGNRINKEFPGPQGPQVQGTDYRYDLENRLIEALDYQTNTQGNRVDRQITTLDYDGNGRRLVKTYDPNEGGGGAKRVEYAFDGLDPIAEYNLWNPQYENFYRGDGNRILTMQHFPNGTDGQMFWYHYDGLGSVSGLTKQHGQSTHNYRYEPYGQIEMPPGNFTDPHNHYAFSGKEWDEHMQLSYFGARHYDPEVGLWITQDTYRGTPRNPLSLHRYAYVENNPTNLVDAYGYCSENSSDGWWQSTGNGLCLLGESTVNVFTDGELATDTTIELERNLEKQGVALDNYSAAVDDMFALILADVCSGSHHDVFNRLGRTKSILNGYSEQSNELVGILDTEIRDMSTAETTLRITKAGLELTMAGIAFFIPGAQGAAAAKVLLVYNSVSYTIDLASGEFDSPEEAVLEGVLTFAPVVGEIGKLKKIDVLVDIAEGVKKGEKVYTAVQCSGSLAQGEDADIILNCGKVILDNVNYSYSKQDTNIEILDINTNTGDIFYETYQETSTDVVIEFFSPNPGKSFSEVTIDASIIIVE